MKVSDALTELAEVVIQSALETAWRDLVARHGRPHYKREGVERGAGFGIAAYGKMGGIELSYGSDLDLVFLHDSPGSGAQTDGDVPIDNGMFYGRLVRRLVHFSYDADALRRAVRSRYAPAAEWPLRSPGHQYRSVRALSG